MGLRIHRPHALPFLLLNLYLPAADPASASELVDQVFEYVAASGEDAIIAGDVNLVHGQAPFAQARASGAWRSFDEVLCGDLPTQGTRRTADDCCAGRVIDFAVGAPAIQPLGLVQGSGHRSLPNP